MNEFSLLALNRVAHAVATEYHLHQHISRSAAAGIAIS